MPTIINMKSFSLTGIGYERTSGYDSRGPSNQNQQENGIGSISNNYIEKKRHCFVCPRKMKGKIPCDDPKKISFSF